MESKEAYAPLEATSDGTAPCAHFLGWQCRLRQYAVRHAGGRPTTGMRPRITLVGDKGTGIAVTVLIIPREPAATTAHMRHIVRRTQDPENRHTGGLALLAAGYYQRPMTFSEEMTALFGPESALADRLLRAGACILDFEQYGQSYHIPCDVRALPEAAPAFQATYWHNQLFNPAMPGGVRVLGFIPDWRRARADPPPP